MSWDSDPYRNMELQFQDQEGEMVRWSCHNCGGVSGNWWITRSVLMEELRWDWLDHVRISHGTKARDTVGWTH